MQSPASSSLLPAPACKPKEQGVAWPTRSGMRKWVVSSFLLYLSCASGSWAQTFQDLDFESPTLVPYPGLPFTSPPSVYLQDALPGWSGSSGTNQFDWAMYDSVFLDVTSIGIFDRNTNVYYDGSAVIQGNYTVALYAGKSLNDNEPADASLSQTGEIPLGAQSLRFFARTNAPFSVSLGGVTLALVSFPVTNQTYSLYKADISAFAGGAELKFTVFAQNPYNNTVHALYLDSIQFSPEAIPEPSALRLLEIGILGVFFWRMTSRKTAQSF
jgi:hypothetical protein